jgi:hypothetical protein
VRKGCSFLTLEDELSSDADNRAAVFLCHPMRSTPSFSQSS